jgi:prepilin-type N-terminal cleavage/methylation domain-containing protein
MSGAKTRAGQRAFTLIELMIVVVIIAIIAAVIVPMLLAKLKGDGRAMEPAAELKQPPPAIAAFDPQGVAVAPPRIESTEVQVSLQTSPSLDGIQVHTRYRAAFRGRFEIAAPDPGAGSVVIELPFPGGTREIRGVSLKVLGADGELREPSGVEYSKRGVLWRAPPEPMALEVSYVAVGSEAFVYDVAGRGRTGRVRFAIELDPEAELSIPERSLEATEIGPHGASWSFESLIADRPIVLELPARSSPLGRMILLFRLAAIGVLLFGAGFWYLSEGHNPGKLDSFRWGHFLVLALDYSLYFAAFPIIAPFTGAPIAAGVAALLALPLLALHVARAIDWRFSLSSATPWAAYTLAVVTVAALIDGARAPVFLATFAGALAWVTTTYKHWSGARSRSREDRRRERELEASRAKVRAAAKIADERSKESEARVQSIERSLEQTPLGFELEQASVRARIREATLAIEDARRLVSSSHSAEDLTEKTRSLEERIAALDASFSALRSAVTESQVSLQEAVLEMDRELERAKIDLDGAEPSGAHQAPASFAQAVKEAKVALEASIGRAIELRRKLGEPDLAPRAARGDLLRLDAILAEKREELSRARSQLERISRTAHGAPIRCSACGAISSPDAAYCSSCGCAMAAVCSCGKRSEAISVSVRRS